jgi:Mg-chelatase subunit ChlD
VSWALPAGLWAAALVVPVLALHVLRPRRVQARVAATYLWRRVARPVSAARPWQRLRPSWLLLVQLLVVLALAAALARPVRLTEEPLAAHTVFVVDASASMAAADGSPTRLDEALARARDLRGRLPVGGEASVVVAGDRARVLLTRSPDPGAFDEVLARIEVGAGAGDFAGAFTLAASLDTGEVPQGVVLLSDGGVPDADLRLVPAGTRFEPVGRSAANRAITRMRVEPAPGGGLVARVTVRNTGGPAASQVLRVDLDGRTVERRPLDLGPGAVLNEAIDLPAGDRVEAFLEGEDLLDLDDRAFATVARRPELVVVWAGPPNPFLDALLAAAADVTVLRHDQVPDPLPTADLLIADRVPVPDDLDLPAWVLAPPGGAAGVAAAGHVEGPVPSLLRADHPLLEGLDLVDLGVAQAQRVDVPADAVVLIGAEGAPLLVRVDRPAGPVLYQSFALADSTLPLSLAFPLLGDRALADLGGAAAPPANLTVGDPLPVDGRTEAMVSAPGGVGFVLAAGHAPPRADRPGFWVVEQPGRAPLTVAVNSDPGESVLEPAAALAIPVPHGGVDPATRQGHEPLLRWVLAGALVLLAVEWALARRRRGVSSRQWRVAQAARLTVAGLVALALVGPTITRSSGRVATVLVLDASDSMGSAGRAEATEWARAALAAKPSGDLAGIVVFGADARLESVVRAEVDFRGPTVQVDASRSDLAAALRLGAAVAPTDARRRVVLVSDGRATEGGADDEARRLGEAGISLDVVPVRTGGGDDVAVTGVRVPAVVRAGDRVTVDVDVLATRAGPARVRVTRGGEPVATVDVDLPAGRTTVTVTDTAPADGVLRYQAEVSAAGDTVPANDVGYAAVPVAGAERVLVVEGREGSADGLVAALEAARLPVDRLAPARLPGADELSRYASVVLVDVDRFSLSDRQVAALTAAVRDLGRGLVVVGGTRAYGLGGYRDTDLEELLPVVSEILDPMRRQTVAQVFAIDTSGSMGACHCAEGSNGVLGGNRVDGGVNKTDISRTSAARAIAALGQNDEIGVLAVSGFEDWVIDLQALPPEDVVREGLARLHPDGSTELAGTLTTAADALRESKASLKHIILFTDGFTEPAHLDRLAEDAAALLAEGITVSVVGTGEGAAVELGAIADAGGGRFYPGRNLEQIPDIIVQEAVMASRDFVNEGEFLPEVVSRAPVVAALTESPPLLGYVATTEKPTAQVLLRIGPDQDPLLSTWRAGLGTVTAWTSDAGDRWAGPWARWDGQVGFWSDVVRDTFPIAGGHGGVRASVRDGRLVVTLETADAWPDGATATVRVADPEGESRELELERVDARTFGGELVVDRAGTYAVGAVVTADGEAVWGGVGLANRSYPAEYEPGGTDDRALARLAALGGGRFAPSPEQAFDAAGLVAGRRAVELSPWLVAAAAALWPLAVALGLLAWRRGVLAVGAEQARHAVSVVLQRRPTPPRNRGS